MAIAEVQIVPIGTPTPSIGDFLADSIRAAKEKGLNPVVGPTGTILEADVARLLEVARAMHEASFTKGVLRVMTTVTIDDRRDKPVTAESKVRSLTQRLR
jgi:uncharacterized protein (TIGR00106 family)